VARVTDRAAPLRGQVLAAQSRRMVALRQRDANAEFMEQVRQVLAMERKTA